MGILCTVDIDFPSTAAGSDDEKYAALPFAGRILEAYWAPATAAALDGTNYAILTIATNDGAGGAYTAGAGIGQITTQTEGMAVDTSRAFTLSGGDREVVKGGMIRLAKTEAGTGALIHGLLTLLIEKPAS